MTQIPNIFDLILIVILLFFLIRTLLRGLVREIMNLIGIATATIVSFFFYDYTANSLQQIFNISTFWWDPIAFISMWIVIFLICLWINATLTHLIRVSPLSWLDRLLGAGIGLIKGILISYLLINMLFVVIPLTMWCQKETQSNNFLTRSCFVPHILKCGHFFLTLIPKGLIHKFQEQASLINNKLEPTFSNFSAFFQLPPNFIKKPQTQLQTIPP